MSISVAETYLNIWYTGRFTGLGIKTGAFIYSFFAIVFLFSLKTNFTSDSIIWKVLVYIGKISFGIYLVHKYFMGYLVIPLVSHLQLSNWLGNQLITISLILVFCMTIIYIAKKLNNRIAVKYLGF